MDINTLKAKIKINQIPDYLVFTGAEWVVPRAYIDQIAKVRNLDVVRVDSVADIYTRLKNNSFLYKSACYVVRDDKELLTNEKLQKQLENGLLGSNVLIHLVTAVDKRTKFYKRYKDQIIEFDFLSDSVLCKYIKRELPELSDKNCLRLIKICENDYGRILFEIDKIKRCENDSVEVLIKDGTIYSPPEAGVFDFVDAVLDKSGADAFMRYRACTERREAVMGLLSALFINIKVVLQVQTCTSKNVEQSTGLSSWQIKKGKVHLKKYSAEELVDMLQLIQKIEMGIKQGLIDEEIAIPYFLVKVL